MKKLLSWLKEYWQLPAALVSLIVMVCGLTALTLNNPKLATDPIEDRFTLYEDQDNKVDCYILDEGKANQTMSCLKQEPLTSQP